MPKLGDGKVVCGGLYTVITKRKFSLTLWGVLIKGVITSNTFGDIFNIIFLNIKCLEVVFEGTIMKQNHWKRGNLL